MKGGKIQNNNDNQRSPANRTRFRSVRGLKRNARPSKNYKADHSISGPALNTNHYPNIIIQYKDVAASTTL
jgi:hypothetical protein